MIMSAVNHGIQISKVEAWTMAKGRCGRCPFDADELIVFMADVATMNHSTSKFISDARSHHFLLNNQECATIPYLGCQLSVFCKPD